LLSARNALITLNTESLDATSQAELIELGVLSPCECYTDDQLCLCAYRIFPLTFTNAASPSVLEARQLFVTEYALPLLEPDWTNFERLGYDVVQFKPIRLLDLDGARRAERHLTSPSYGCSPLSCNGLAVFYPSYEAWLETSIKAEPVEFFRELFAKNLPVDGFVDSDWTMANVRLCDFYGLPEPKTGGFQRVSLKPEDHRGGLLMMGAVLGLTSDGTRHRPVHRGVWISEVVLGKTPPPPPANVPAIEPNPPQNPKATLREKIEAHRNDANCAACHAKIDPLGLAWDNYDAIGQWRTHEKVAVGLGADPLVNPSGEMPDGRAFKDATDFKQRLLEDRDKVARAFIEHLCTYGLRRVLSVDDQDDLNAIAVEAKKNQYRVKDIVRAVALSELMRKR